MSTSQSLKQLKEQLEIQKLRKEIAQMDKKNWITSGVITSVLSALVALGSVLYMLNSDKLEIREHLVELRTETLLTKEAKLIQDSLSFVERRAALDANIEAATRAYIDSIDLFRRNYLGVLAKEKRALVELNRTKASFMSSKSEIKNYQRRLIITERQKEILEKELFINKNTLTDNKINLQKLSNELDEKRKKIKALKQDLGSSKIEDYFDKGFHSGYKHGIRTERDRINVISSENIR